MKTMVSLAVFLFASSVLADEYPSRKAGLWEVEVSMPDMPGQKMTQCIDAETDQALIVQSENLSSERCTRSEMTKQGADYVHESDCTFAGTRMVSTMVLSGDFETAYRGEMTTRYDPPLAGQTEMTMELTANYLGPCKDGQEPGDVYMADGTRINSVSK